VGLDRRSPVCWDVYERHGPFPFTGTIESVAYSPGTPAPDSPVDLVGFLRDWGRRFE
jgi:arylsulfatase